MPNLCDPITQRATPVENPRLNRVITEAEVKELIAAVFEANELDPSLVDDVRVVFVDKLRGKVLGQACHRTHEAWIKVCEHYRVDPGVKGIILLTKGWELGTMLPQRYLIVVHEAAHVVIGEKYGFVEEDHGEEFKAAMNAAGVDYEKTKRTMSTEVLFELPMPLIGRKTYGVNPKNTRSANYVHRDHVGDLSEEQQEQVKAARRHLPHRFNYTVIKVAHDGSGVSFIESHNWNDVSNPAVGESYKVHPDGSVAFTPSTGKVYHKKALFNPRDYRPNEIKVANATDRPGGVYGTMKGVVAQHVYKLTRGTSGKVLDFGAGKEAKCTKALRKAGRDVTAWDFGDNFVNGTHHPKALDRQYAVVFASNVLNVQASKPALEETVSQIAKATRKTGTAVVNYPSSPRKSGVSDKQLVSMLGKQFASVEKVGDHLYELRHAAQNPPNWADDWIAENYNGKHNLVWYDPDPSAGTLPYYEFRDNHKDRLPILLAALEQAERAADALGCEIPVLEIRLKSSGKTAFLYSPPPEPSWMEINIHWTAGPENLGDIDPSVQWTPVQTILHEFGHVYYWYCLRDRYRWISEFGARPFVSMYAETNDREEFAEVFRRVAVGHSIPEESSWWLMEEYSRDIPGVTSGWATNPGKPYDWARANYLLHQLFEVDGHDSLLLTTEQTEALFGKTIARANTGRWTGEPPPAGVDPMDWPRAAVPRGLALLGYYSRVGGPIGQRYLQIWKAIAPRWSPPRRNVPPGCEYLPPDIDCSEFLERRDLWESLAELREAAQQYAPQPDRSKEVIPPLFFFSGLYPVRYALARMVLGKKKEVPTGEKVVADHPIGVSLHSIAKGQGLYQRSGDLYADWGYLFEWMELTSAPVFVDNGAFSMFNRKDVRDVAPVDRPGIDPNRVLGIYEELVRLRPEWANRWWFTAPDRIADPGATENWWDEYGDRLRTLMLAGPRMIFPVQAGGLPESEQPMAIYQSALKTTLDFPTAIIGVPSKQGAIRPSTAKAGIRLMQEKGLNPPAGFHFLGKQKDLVELSKQVREIMPGVRVSGDAKTVFDTAQRTLVPGPGAGKRRIQTAGKLMIWMESKIMSAATANPGIVWVF